MPCGATFKEGEAPRHFFWALFLANLEDKTPAFDALAELKHDAIRWSIRLQLAHYSGNLIALDAK